MQNVYDPDGNALLFATTPKRIGPDPNSKYSPEAFFLPEYNGYFHDLLQMYQGRYPPRGFFGPQSSSY